MKIENTIKVIKEVHPDRVVMCKIGPFMHCYGRDAVIMSYLFDYSLKKIDNNYDCGFPNGALNKIMGTLEGKKISYMVVNRADNFAVENEMKNGTVMWPVRIAVSGKAMTPGGAVEILDILGKEESIARIKKGIELLSK